MAKATLKMPDGTLVEIEGTAGEIERLLEFYSNRASQSEPTLQASTPPKKKQARKQTASVDSDNKPDLAKIVNLVKDCDEAEQIETQILDRSGQVNRVLLPLYIVYEHMSNAIGLTSGDVKKITTDLGISIHIANASKTLSKTASKYVIGDTTRRKGQPVRYKLSRRGIQYFKSILKDI